MDATLVLNVMFLDLCLDRYKDALVLLLREVLNRIQFRYNQAQLEELDDETLDDDVRTFDTDVATKYLKRQWTFVFFFFCNGATIATDRVAAVPASESGGRCQGDGVTSVPCILHFGKTLTFLSAHWRVSDSFVFLLSTLSNIHT